MELAHPQDTQVARLGISSSLIPGPHRSQMRLPPGYRTGRDQACLALECPMHWSKPKPTPVL